MDMGINEISSRIAELEALVLNKDGVIDQDNSDSKYMDNCTELAELQNLHEELLITNKEI